MSGIGRRELLTGLGASAAAAAPGFRRAAWAQEAPPRVVIIGGGAGGATVAAYLRRQAPAIAVTLVEPNERYTTCFLSNLCIGGFRTLKSLGHSYGGLEQQGVTVIHRVAVDVDAARKTVTLIDGVKLPYDRLVLSPGFDVRYDAIEGYTRDAVRVMPHAWRAGWQTELLKRQIEEMPDGGVVAIAVPAEPSVCPPGPYERACMIAHLLKTRKPRSKLVILDAKSSIPKQAVFMEAFQKYYSGIVEINLTTELDDYSVVTADPVTRTIVTKGGERIKADVANIIPPQRAGGIARRAGCAEGDWCPVVPETFASAKVPDIYVLGDAAVASDMPKSAYSANSQGKLVANVLASELTDAELYPRRLRNTCWSLVAPNDSVKIGANYHVGALDGHKRLVAFDGFVSEPGEDASERQRNYRESLGWYSAMTAEMFGGV